MTPSDIVGSFWGVPLIASVRFPGFSLVSLAAADLSTKPEPAPLPPTPSPALPPTSHVSRAARCDDDRLIEATSSAI